MFLLLAIVPRAAEKRFITEKDLFKFTWIADPQIAPDGSTIPYVRVTVNEKENRYETSLFTVGTTGAEAARRLTSNVRDTMPRWSPDGRRIAFVRSIEKDGKPQPGQVYLLDMNGGEAYPLTRIDTKGVTSIEWSPDGKTMAFTAPVGGEEQDKRDGKEQEKKSDVQAITRAVYRANSNPAYVDAGKHTHIFTVAATNADKIAIDEADHRRRVRRAEKSSGRRTVRRSLLRIHARAPRRTTKPSDSDLYSRGDPLAERSRRSPASKAPSTAPRVSPDVTSNRIFRGDTPTGTQLFLTASPICSSSTRRPGSAPRNLTEVMTSTSPAGSAEDQAPPPRAERQQRRLVEGRRVAHRRLGREHGSANLKRLTIATGKVRTH